MFFLFCLRCILAFEQTSQRVFREMLHLVLSRLGLLKRTFWLGATDDFNFVPNRHFGRVGSWVVGGQLAFR